MRALTSNCQCLKCTQFGVVACVYIIPPNRIRHDAHLEFNMFGGWRGDRENKKWRRRSSGFFTLERRVMSKRGRGVICGMLRVFMMVRSAIAMIAIYI